MANFGISDDDTGKVIGNLGFIGDIGSVSSEFVIGSAMDLFGRKGITVFGLFVAGLGLAAQPLPSQIGWLYPLRVISCVGVIPALYTPYTVDYVKKESLGLLNGYITIMSNIAGLICTSGAIYA